jgi:hypothetical protein
MQHKITNEMCALAQWDCWHIGNSMGAKYDAVSARNGGQQVNRAATAE